jgi:hypothetical protein
MILGHGEYTNEGKYTYFIKLTYITNFFKTKKMYLKIAYKRRQLIQITVNLENRKVPFKLPRRRQLIILQFYIYINIAINK